MLEYMREHGQDEDAAQWLAQEYGSRADLPLHFTVTGTDIDIVWEWPQVRNRLAELIEEGRFDEERANVGIYLGERDNTLFFYAPVNFVETVFSGVGVPL